MTPAQRERFTILAEEATEVAQAVCKSLRFGMEDKHPVTGETSTEKVESELGDLYYVVQWMSMEQDISMDRIGMSFNTKARRIAPYLRQQSGDENGSKE